MTSTTKKLIPLLFLVVVWPSRASATRIEDLCDIQGIRPNQIVGYGLVVGLNNTGDTGMGSSARFTVQSVAAMLRRLGATIDPKSIQTRNAAAVMITAVLPAQVNPGTRIDVVVSSLGNARSLAGGTLLQTPLYGANRKVYAVAQGPVLVGGFSSSGFTGSRVQYNHTTAGRVPQGAIVERRPPSAQLGDKEFVLTLKDPSFVTAQRIAEAINQSIGDSSASALDAASVRVSTPADYKDKSVELVSKIQLLEVDPDSPAKVVINERTGTVVLGANVRITESAVAQGSLTVEVSEQPTVSQPNALAGGDTTVVPQSRVKAETPGTPIKMVPKGATLAEVVDALNALGAKPRDLISIFQALQRSGALQASIEVQ